MDTYMKSYGRRDRQTIFLHVMYIYRSLANENLSKFHKSMYCY